MIVPAAPAHIDEIRPTEPLLCGLEIVKQITSHHPSWTLLDSGKPVVVAGFIHICQGMAEAWALIDQNIRPMMLRQAKRFFDRYCRDFNLRRVQAVVRADFCVGIRMSLFFGFVNEGLMRRYGPFDIDHLRLAWVLQ